MPPQLPLHLTNVFVRIISQTVDAGNLVVGLVTIRRSRHDQPRILWAEGLLRYYRDVLEARLDAESISLRLNGLDRTLDTLICRGEIPVAVLTCPRNSTQTDCHWDVEAVTLSGHPIETLTPVVQEAMVRFFASLPFQDKPHDKADPTGPTLSPESISDVAAALHRDIELVLAAGERFLALAVTKPGQSCPVLFWDTDLILTLDPTESTPRRTLAAHLREAQIRGILQAGFFPIALAFFFRHKGVCLESDTAEITRWGFDATAELNRVEKALHHTLGHRAQPRAALNN